MSSGKKVNLVLPSRNVKAGIIGLTNCGKTSVFNMLSDSNAIVDSTAFTTIDPNYATSAFLDEQLTGLAEVYRPDKTCYSFVSLLDSCGLVRGSHVDEGYGNDFMSLHQPMDLLIHVVRAFDDENITHCEETIDPIRDIKIVNDELIEKDIELCSFTISTQEYAYQQGKLGAEGKHEYLTLIKIYETLSGKFYVKKGKAASDAKSTSSKTTKTKGPPPKVRVLEAGRPLRMVKWDKNEMVVLLKHNFLTAKEQVYIINLSMRDCLRENDKYTTTLMTNSAADVESGMSVGERLQAVIDAYGGGGFIKLSVGFEQYFKERKNDSPEDFQDYLHANPRHRSAVGPIFFQLYRQLDLIRYYTVDKYMDECECERVREVKIWFCQQGTYAPEAAGRILTDMERGFLCADVMTYCDVVELGSEAKVRRVGKLRQQGKRYIMNDCDVVYFQYNKFQVA